MKTKKTLLVSLLGIVIIFTLFLHNLSLKPKFGDDNYLPLKDIIYVQWDKNQKNTQQSIGFSNSDGSGYLSVVVKIPVGILFRQNILKQYSSYINYSAAWGNTGDAIGFLLGIPSKGGLGYPVVFNSKGRFSYCIDVMDPPLTAVPFWILSGSKVLIVDYYKNTPDQTLIIYDLDKCKIVDKIYKPEVGWEIHNAALSTQNWLAINHTKGFGEKKEYQILVISPDGEVRYAIDDWGDLSWSKNGDQLALIRQNKYESARLVILNINDGKEREITNAESSPSWSPDGTKIVFERDGGIFVINLITLEETKIGEGYSPSWRWQD